jgi:hypothetical protein
MDTRDYRAGDRRAVNEIEQRQRLLNAPSNGAAVVNGPARATRPRDRPELALSRTRNVDTGARQRTARAAG